MHMRNLLCTEQQAQHRDQYTTDLCTKTRAYKKSTYKI